MKKIKKGKKMQNDSEQVRVLKKHIGELKEENNNLRQSTNNRIIKSELDIKRIGELLLSSSEKVSKKEMKSSELADITSAIKELNRTLDVSFQNSTFTERMEMKSKSLESENKKTETRTREQDIEIAKITGNRKILDKYIQ
jgi:hypothetical protein